MCRVLGLVPLRLEPRRDARVVLEAQARVVLDEGGLVVGEEVQRAPLGEVRLGEAGRELKASIRIAHLVRIRARLGVGMGVQVRAARDRPN